MSIQRAERELLLLQQEIERLDARINEARNRALKLGHYIELVREFDEPIAAATSGIHAESMADEAAPINGTRQRVPHGGMSGRAVQECISILRQRGKPIHTKELFEMIQQRGITLGGANPMQALSGYLSRTPGLIASRSVGWSLQEWLKPEESAADDSKPTHNDERGSQFQS